MDFPFSIKPAHWYDYINPFWWRRKKTVEAVLNYSWHKSGMEEKLDKAVRDAYLYGDASFIRDWKEWENKND